MEWLSQGSGEIHEKHNSIALGVVPHFVVVSVIKNQRLSFGPLIKIIRDPNPAFLFGLGYQQTEVQSEHAIESASVCRDMLFRGKNRKKGRFDARNFAQNSHGFRATIRVFGAVHPDPGQEEGFPIVVMGYRSRFFQDFVETRDLIAKIHDLIELFSDASPARLNVRDPME